MSIMIMNWVSKSNFGPSLFCQIESSRLRLILYGGKQKLPIYSGIYCDITVLFYGDKAAICVITGTGVVDPLLP